MSGDDISGRMTTEKALNELLDKTLEKSELPGLAEPIRGKVRDIYDLGDRLLLVTTDRISAFDVVLGTVPCKGQVLNTIAKHWFEKTADLVPNHMLEAPDPAAVVVKKLQGLPVEVVMRRYLTGSLWRDYENGTRQIYGISLPDGMQRDQQFEKPILTPTTKAELGQHDMPLSPAEIVEQNLVAADLWKKVEEAALALFERGEQEAHKQGLILVDTKYEFGLDGKRLLVMDEIHTPDSSRYWEREEYQARFEKGDSQKMLDKENIRQWLIERGFSGQGSAPPLTDAVRVSLARTYLNLQKRLTNIEADLPGGDPNQRLVANLRKAAIIK
jgi:phosphoribosylaminoimidazole-succinocarboxamide synthase